MVLQDETGGRRFRLVEAQMPCQATQHDAEAVDARSPDRLPQRQGSSVHVARIGDHMARFTSALLLQQDSQGLGGAAGRHRSGERQINFPTVVQVIKYLASSLGI